MENESSIIKAASCGDVEKVKKLLATGADVDSQTRGDGHHFGQTLLMIAAENGNAEIVTLLLERGADIHAVDKTKYRSAEEAGRTALHYAALGRHPQIVRKLLEAKANPNVKTTFGRTPLYFATQKSDLETVVVLIEAGASLEHNQKTYPAVLANAAVTWDSVVSIEPETGLERRKEKPCSDSRSIEMVSYLLSHGADVNGTDEIGGTALHKASSYGNFELVALLLQKGADLVHRDKNGLTALMLACSEGAARVVELLLKKGANANDVDTNGKNSLHRAVERNPETVKLLLEANANFNAMTKDGNTALDLCEQRVQLISRWEKDLMDPELPAWRKEWIRQNLHQKTQAQEIAQLLLTSGGARGADVKVGDVLALKKVPAEVDFSRSAGRVEFQDAVSKFAAQLGNKPQPMLRVEGEKWVSVSGVFVIDGPESKIEGIVAEQQSRKLKKAIFLVLHVFGMFKGNPKCQLGVLPTSDKYNVIRAVQPSGPNYDINSEDIVNFLTELERIRIFSLIGIGFDRVILRFDGPDKNLRKLATFLSKFQAEIISPEREEYLDSPSLIERAIRKDPRITLFWEH